MPFNTDSTAYRDSLQSNHNQRVDYMQPRDISMVDSGLDSRTGGTTVHHFMDGADRG